MPKGSAPQKKIDPKKASLANSFSVSSREEKIDEQVIDHEESIHYVRRTITIANDLDGKINELVRRERKLGKRENRSSIVEMALRAYFEK